MMKAGLINCRSHHSIGYTKWQMNNQLQQQYQNSIFPTRAKEGITATKQMQTASHYCTVNQAG